MEPSVTSATDMTNAAGDGLTTAVLLDFPGKEKEMEASTSQQMIQLTLYVYNDEDKLFILSLVEEIQRMTNEQKTVFKLKTWQIIAAIHTKEGRSMQQPARSINEMSEYYDQSLPRDNVSYQQYDNGFENTLVGHLARQDQQYAAGRVKKKELEYFPDINVGQDNDEDSDATIDDTEYDRIAAGRVRNKDLEYFSDINVGQDNDEDMKPAMDDSEYDKSGLATDCNLINEEIPSGMRIKTEHQEHMSSLNESTEFYKPTALSRTSSNSSNNKRRKLNKITDETTSDNIIENEDSMKLYRCKVCRKMFHLKTDLTKHMTHHKQVNKHPPTVDQSNGRGNSHKSTPSTEEESENSEKPFGCTLCTYRCSRSGALSRHMLVHTGEKRFPCTQCPHRCNRSDKLSRHMRTMHNIEPSPLGSNQYSRRKNLLPTGELGQADEKPFFCTVCSYRCDKKSRLTRHMLTHMGKTWAGRVRSKDIKCIPDINAGQDNHEDINATKDDSEYDKPQQTAGSNLLYEPYPSVLPSGAILKTEDEKQTTSREKINRLPGEKPFLCTVCSSRFRKNCQLSVHMRSHTGEKPFLCGICPYRCSRSSHLSRHMLRHTGEKKFACAECPYRSNRNDKLSAHMLTHARNKDPSHRDADQSTGGNSSIKCSPNEELGEARRYLCTLCPYDCGQRSQLSKHMRSHTGEKPFLCAACPYQCSQRSMLSEHMRSHAVEKQFACTVCSYRCIKNSNLATHMRRHTGEKPFACTLCTYRARRSCDLSEHMRSHTGERKLTCTLCSYRCNNTNKMARHMRSHTGEKPYACTLCTFRCSQGGDLSRHIGRSHASELPDALNVQ